MIEGEHARVNAWRVAILRVLVGLQQGDALGVRSRPREQQSQRTACGAAAKDGDIKISL